MPWTHLCPVIWCEPAVAARAEEGGEGPAMDRFDPGAPPPFELADTHAAIPKHCQMRLSAVSRVSLMYPPRDERWIWRREGAGGEEEEDTVPPPCTSNFSILFLQNRDGQLVNIPNGYIHWKWGAIDVVGLIGFAGSNQIALQVLCKNCFLYYEKAQYFFAVNYICKCYVWLLDCSRDTIYRVLIVQFACLLLIYTVIQGVNCSVCLLVAYLHSDALI